MTWTNPTAVTFLCYLGAMVTLGFIAWRLTDSLSDYILGGRRLGAFVTAMSAGASDMSGWLLMGLPGALYGAGLVEGWIAVGLTLGAWLNWRLVAGRLRIYTEISRDALTLPDFFSHRFADQSGILRVLTAGVILVFFTIYCASGMVAGARLFETIFDMGYHASLWAGASTTIFYVFIGGFLAVSWTDTAQALLMAFALILTPTLVVQSLGGVNEAMTIIRGMDPRFINPFDGIGPIGLVSLLSWGLGYMGQPHILTRFMAARSLEATRRARRIAMCWMILCLVGAMSAGFLGIAYFKAHPAAAAPVLANHEAVFIELARDLFNPWLAGLILSAILAAIMSTLSCQLLVCASALTQDFYKALLRPGAGDFELVCFSRGTVLLVAAIAMFIASDEHSRVLGLVAYAWAGFGAAFGPVIILSLSWSRLTLRGALAGVITGATTAIAWHNGDWFGYAGGPIAGVYEILPGFLVAMGSAGVVSLLDKAPDDAICAAFLDMETRLHLDSTEPPSGSR